VTTYSLVTPAATAGGSRQKALKWTVVKEEKESDERDGTHRYFLAGSVCVKPTDTPPAQLAVAGP
jgi:hypothetical protein